MFLAAPSALRSFKQCAVVLVLSAGISGPLKAAERMPVDRDRQSSMFQRIFSYDKLLRNSPKIVILVVATARDSSDAQEMAAAFREQGMYPAIVTVDGLTDDLTATLTPLSTVMYLMPEIDYMSAQAFAVERGFLSISGLPSLVLSGHVSVSVDRNGGRIEIVVNIPRLNAEGHELSAELLKLARIIR